VPETPPTPSWRIDLGDQAAQFYALKIIHNHFDVFNVFLDIDPRKFNLRDQHALSAKCVKVVYSANIISFLPLNFLLDASHDTSRNHQQRSIKDE
jgi:hypothetical protein